ncbi:MAG: hypothetical protein U0W24_17840 [Bacteroidales bacterium]
MSLPEHSKIINKVASQILKPYGLDRKGQSRTWLDDQNWYTTMIEFQPFSNRQGTCINVGVNFHWYPQDCWSFDIGYRESEFVDFENTDQFTLDVEKLAKIGLEKTLNYRQLLIDFKTTKQTIIRHQFASDNLWGNYHKGLICGLIGDKKELNDYYDRLLGVENDAPWTKDLKFQVKELKDISVDIDKFRSKIIAIIRDTRRLKKLKDLEIEFK